MVLVDTCIWIFSLAGRQPYRSILDALLARDEVTGHDLVHGELLIGDNGGRGGMLATYRRIRQVAAVPHQDVIMLVEARKLHGIGLSWIDAHLLASALASHNELWTDDDTLTAAAKHLGVAYVP